MQKSTDYEIPVSKNTVDKMVETMLKENERLERENQELKKQLGEGEPAAADPDDLKQKIAEEISKYM